MHKNHFVVHCVFYNNESNHLETLDKQLISCKNNNENDDLLSICEESNFLGLDENEIPEYNVMCK